MKTVTVSAQSKAVVALLDKARQGALILHDPDGRAYILAEIDDLDPEIEWARKDPDLMRFLDERDSQTAVLSLEEVKAALGID